MRFTGILEEREMVANTAFDTFCSGEEGALSVLTDPRQEVRDLKLLNRAVRGRWDIPLEHRKAIVNRLLGIVSKEQVTVMTKAGPYLLEEPADKNAILAAKVLAGMEGQNQADEHLASRPKESSSEMTINIGAIGKLSMGQEPLSPSDAKLQAEEILQRVLERSNTAGIAKSDPNLMERDLSTL